MVEADGSTALSQTDAPPSLTITTDTLEFLPAQLLQVRKDLCFSNMRGWENRLKIPTSAT